MWNVSFFIVCVKIFKQGEQIVLILIMKGKKIEKLFLRLHQGLRFLVRLSTDMGLMEVQEYATKLKKVEKMKEIREQVYVSPLSDSLL